MFSKFIKSVLVFNRAQNKAPNFFLVYFLISIAWHHQVFITFAASNTGFSDRLSTALAEHSFQYAVVLFLTFLFFILRLSLLYFLNKTDQFIEADEPIEAKIGSDQVFKENKDVERLLALLEETKAQLAKVKAREAASQADKISAISKMLALQAELDIAMADIAILGKSNEELSIKLNECKVA
ncbi:hypothetical protein H4J38_14865 [Colwellia sp. BRX10-3]|uniref:hypothetical protein n=1 Tax=Colwellia sp. BRX10-3 TaxID=2759844 RepID=UPI0015F6E66D|nr:hypothetical protein [Colwellia sp. BRX10-3]MBA6392055.1 hypothetical protein [Colwellia sp. BRX10-3]